MDQDKQDEVQVEAEKKNVIPDTVEMSNEADAVQAYGKQQEELKDKLSKYGVTDMQAMTAKMGSDPLFADAVVKDMLGIKSDTPLVLGKVSNASQENSITGVLDHSTYPPTLKKAPDASVPDGKPEGVV